MKATILQHLQAKVSSEKIRALYEQPAPRDYTLELLAWFGRIPRRWKLAICIGLWLFVVWCGCTPG